MRHFVWISILCFITTATNIKHALAFYKDMMHSISLLKPRVSDFILERKKEAATFIDKMSRDTADFSSTNSNTCQTISPMPKRSKQESIDSNSSGSAAKRSLASLSSMNYERGRLSAAFVPSFKWTKGQLIGQGAFGKVYMGFSELTGETIAVKQVPLHNPKAKSQIAPLESEIKIMEQLSHPNIVKYLGSERYRYFDESFLFLVLMILLMF